MYKTLCKSTKYTTKDRKDNSIIDFFFLIKNSYSWKEENYILCQKFSRGFTPCLHLDDVFNLHHYLIKYRCICDKKRKTLKIRNKKGQTYFFTQIQNLLLV